MDQDLRLENNKKWNNLCLLLFELLSISLFCHITFQKKKTCICFHFSPLCLMEKFLTGIIPSASFYVQDPRLLEIFPTLIHYDGKVNLTGFFMKFIHSWNYFLLTDQEELRKMLENCLKGGVPAAVKGKKVYLVVEQSWNFWWVLKEPETTFCNKCDFKFHLLAE